MASPRCRTDTLESTRAWESAVRTSHTGEDIKRANDELRKLPERPKKLEEPKSCAACQ